MTEVEKIAVLAYVADNFVAPLIYSKVPAHELWETMSGDTYNNFVEFINTMLDK